MAAGKGARKDDATESTTLTIGQARDRLSEYALNAGLAGEVYTLIRRKKPVAVLVGHREFERLRALDAGVKK